MAIQILKRVVMENASGDGPSFRGARALVIARRTVCSMLDTLKPHGSVESILNSSSEIHDIETHQGVTCSGLLY